MWKPLQLFYFWNTQIFAHVRKLRMPLEPVRRQINCYFCWGSLSIIKYNSPFSTFNSTFLSTLRNSPFTGARREKLDSYFWGFSFFIELQWLWHKYRCIVLRIFKGYAPFIDNIKCWLYSPCCPVHPCSLSYTYCSVPPNPPALSCPSRLPLPW